MTRSSRMTTCSLPLVRRRCAPLPGADSQGVHSFWTLEQAQGVIRQIRPGCSVVMVGAGFIAFTILNAILSHGAQLSVVEIAPQILPRDRSPGRSGGGAVAA